MHPIRRGRVLRGACRIDVRRRWGPNSVVRESMDRWGIGAMGEDGDVVFHNMISMMIYHHQVVVGDRMWGEVPRRSSSSRSTTTTTTTLLLRKTKKMTSTMTNTMTMMDEGNGILSRMSKGTRSSKRLLRDNSSYYYYTTTGSLLCSTPRWWWWWWWSSFDRPMIFSFPWLVRIVSSVHPARPVRCFYHNMFL